VVPITFDNGARANSVGFEASGSWRISRRVRLRGWYSYLHLSFEPKDESTDISNPAGDVPQHQARLWASVDLPHDFMLDVSAQFVDRLSVQNVPSYVRGDIRLEWHPGDHFQAEAGVRNLLDRRHTEFVSPNEVVVASQIERTWYAGLTWRF
jgi:iron complex outermembrane receptor protein